MNKVYLYFFALDLFILSFAWPLFANEPSNWASKYEAQKAFIENKGQFNIKATSGFDQKVLFAFDGDAQKFYFTRSGVVFGLSNIKRPKQSRKDEREEKEQMKKGMTPEEHEEMEENERKLLVDQDELRGQWIGADPNVEIIAEDKTESYYSYSFKNADGILTHENNIAAFKKLTYKNLYPNIDVVYEMHPQTGIKYSVIVHPGGDASQVRLQYSKRSKLLPDGDIKTKSRFGDFIDHAPLTYYEEDRSPIASSYDLKGSTISFALANYDHSKTLVIDPWTQAPSFATQWHCVWECQKDGAGNVYIIGGVMPMQLLKYNSAGALQWTYSTPYDTSNCWLGTFAVDNVGNSYVTAGSIAQIEKVTTAGSVVWSNSNVGGIFSTSEFWDISFNCDQTQLVVGGTGGTITPYIYNIDMANGNVLNSVEVTGGALIPTEEVRAITACGNGNYYFLTHDSIGYIHQGLTSCLPPGSSFPFHVNNTYNFSYKCEDFRVNNTGIKAIKAFGGYIYTHRGNVVHKRNFNTAAIIGTGTIPGGVFTNSGFGGSYVSNSGIDIDSCGNVYVGSVNEVVKFDANLNQIATYPTSSSFNVYDVQVSTGGNIIAAGTTGNDNSGARTGYVESFAAGACSAIAIVCCDATICPHAAVCSNAAPFTFTSTTAGGTWSGTGITNTSTGTFSPAVSGVGTFTVYYTLACGKDSTTITVNNCSSISVCKNANGTLTVSGGTAPYTWAKWDSTGQTCQGGIVLFGICTGTWVATYGFSNFATGATVTVPAGVDTITVSDAGTTDTIYNIAALPLCTACSLTATPGTIRNVLCHGASTGAAYVTVTGGTAPLTYTWSPNVSTLDSAVNIAAGTYSVTVHDANGCTGTATFTITQPTAALTAASTTVPTSCGNNNGKVYVTPSGGTSGYTYTWSPNVSINDSAINLASGNYLVTVTDANHCTAATSATVAASTVLSLSTSSTPASCGGSNGSATVTPTGGTTYTYLWSNNGTTATISSIPNGTYTVTVTSGACTAVTSVSVSSTNGVTASLGSKTNVKCYGAATGSANITASGGTLPYTYTWSSSGSLVDSAENLAAGSYSVTVKDANNCTSLVTFTITQPLSALSATDNTLPAYCGNSTGRAYITASGGTSGYTYTWSPNVSTNDSAVNLAAGAYLVTVTDANHCTVSLTATVQPAAGVVLTVASQQSVTCNGGTNGKIYVTAAGGVGPYTYIWSPAVSTTDSAVGLSQGTYNVTVKDANNCTSAQSVTISQPIAIVVSTSTTPANCGISDGTATAIVTGGTGTLVYHWSVGTSVTATNTALAAGSYTVTVTDANQCTGTGTAAISNIGGPTATIASVINENCAGGNSGKIILSVTGGTQPYTYTWSSNVSTTDSAVNLAAGSYAVTIHDASSCIAVVDTAITQPLALSLSMQSANTGCGQSDGWAKVTAGGGTGSYTYTWSVAQNTDSITALSAGTYYVTVADALGCQATDSVTVGSNNGPPAPVISAGGPLTFCQGGSVTLTSSALTGNIWSTGATTQSITVSVAGSYTVTQTVGSCSSPVSAAVTISVNPIPPAPVITASGPTSFCAGGSVTLTSSAASGNLWSDHETTPSIVVTSAGIYTVSDTQSGCPSPTSAPVTVTIISSPQIVIHPSQLSLCPGIGSDTLDATTASATAYLWSTGSSQPSISITTPGTYGVTVTVGGCSGSDSVTITSQPLLGTLALPDSFLICRGDSIILDATTLNATAYLWSGVVSASTPILTADSPGIYTVSVSNNCGSVSGSTTVSIQDCDCRIVMANAFTPNGDGINDVFGPDIDCINANYLLMRIFNRWGEKVYETYDLNGKWDGRYKGTMQPPGVYVYYVDFVGMENNTERSFKLVGSFTLIR